MDVTIHAALAAARSSKAARSASDAYVCAMTRLGSAPCRSALRGLTRSTRNRATVWTSWRKLQGSQELLQRAIKERGELHQEVVGGFGKNNEL